jgi:hypothetical protein
MTQEIPKAEIHNITNGSLTPYIRKLLTLLKPMDVDNHTLIRVGRDFDGGYVMVNNKLENAVCYSMGISDDVSWDLAMAEQGCNVFQYDHTIDNFPVINNQFYSFKIGISAVSTGESNLRTIEELIEMNEHQSENDIILKMDIEYAEWDVFEKIKIDLLNKFSQIVVEIHGLEHSCSTHHLRKYLDVLKKISTTHQIVHIHANNYGPVAFIGGIMIPGTFEVTMVRKNDYTFTECKKVFPTPLDMPCDTARPDYFLGTMGLY